MKKNIDAIKNYVPVIVMFMVAMTIFLTGTNHKLFFIINAHHDWLPVVMWKAIIFITWEKDGLLPIALLIITWIYRREKMKNVLMLIVAYYALFFLLKITVHEARPYIQYDPSTFYWLPQHDVTGRAYHSFPSGHTGNMAIFVFSLIYFFVQEKPWIRPVLALCLVLTMMAQICTGWHFPLDVIGSAILGFILTAVCLRWKF